MAGSHPPCFRLTGAPSPAGVRSPRPLGWPPCSPSNCPVDTLQFWVEIQRLREALSPGPRVYPGLATCPFSSSRCLHWVLVPSLLLACPPHSPYPFGPKREREGIIASNLTELLWRRKMGAHGPLTRACPATSAHCSARSPGERPLSCCVAHGAPRGAARPTVHGTPQGKCGPGRAHRFPVRLWGKWDYERKSTS